MWLPQAWRARVSAESCVSFGAPHLLDSRFDPARAAVFDHRQGDLFARRSPVCRQVERVQRQKTSTTQAGFSRRLPLKPWTDWNSSRGLLGTHERLNRKCLSNPLNLRFNPTRLNDGFNDQRHIDRNHIRQLPKGQDGRVGKRIVLTACIDFADVNLAKLRMESTENEIRLRHCTVNLPSVSDIKAQASLWETLEQRFEFVRRPSDRFSLVHVLNAESTAKLAPQGVVHDYIGVDDNGPASFRNT